MGPMPISLRAMALPLMAALLAACATPSPGTFGEDADGELYLADIESGTIYRVVSGD